MTQNNRSPISKTTTKNTNLDRYLKNLVLQLLNNPEISNSSLAQTQNEECRISFREVTVDTSLSIELNTSFINKACNYYDSIPPGTNGTITGLSKLLSDKDEDTQIEFKLVEYDYMPQLNTQFSRSRIKSRLILAYQCDHSNTFSFSLDKDPYNVSFTAELTINNATNALYEGDTQVGIIENKDSKIKYWLNLSYCERLVQQQQDNTPSGNYFNNKYCNENTPRNQPNINDQSKSAIQAFWDQSSNCFYVTIFNSLMSQNSKQRFNLENVFRKNNLLLDRNYNYNTPIGFVENNSNQNNHQNCERYEVYESYLQAVLLGQSPLQRAQNNNNHHSKGNSIRFFGSQGNKAEPDNLECVKLNPSNKPFWSPDPRKILGDYNNQVPINNNADWSKVDKNHGSTIITALFERHITADNFTQAHKELSLWVTDLANIDKDFIFQWVVVSSDLLIILYFILIRQCLSTSESPKDRFSLHLDMSKKISSYLFSRFHEAFVANYMAYKEWCENNYHTTSIEVDIAEMRIYGLEIMKNRISEVFNMKTSAITNLKPSPDMCQNKYLLYFIQLLFIHFIEITMGLGHKNCLLHILFPFHVHVEDKVNNNNNSNCKTILDTLRLSCSVKEAIHAMQAITINKTPEKMLYLLVEFHDENKIHFSSKPLEDDIIDNNLDNKNNSAKNNYINYSDKIDYLDYQNNMLAILKSMFSCIKRNAPMNMNRMGLFKTVFRGKTEWLLYIKQGLLRIEDKQDILELLPKYFHDQQQKLSLQALNFKLQDFYHLDKFDNTDYETVRKDMLEYGVDW